MPTYRADIDGLRGVAVLSVVLFHAGIDGFSSGFVGVDIFFVISGFLMTSIIAGGIARGDFTLAGFYARRVRRIGPALIAVLAATWCAGYLILLPAAFSDLSASVIATLGMGSNILFWRTSGYFSAAAEMKPLLHGWSLAVEEQFYLLFPLAMLALGRQKTGPMPAARWRLWFGAAAILSFGICVWATRTAPSAAFYLLPARGWELLLGAVPALNIPAPPRRRIVAEIQGAAGLALIAAGIAGIGPHMIFQALPAPILPLTGLPPTVLPPTLLPCLGAALIIQAGRGHHPTLAGRLLALKPLVFVGLISYSFYLWHWPVLVFQRHLSIDAVGTTDALMAIALAGGISVVSWRLIERPFRRRPGPDNSGSSDRPGRVFATAGIAATVMALAAMAGLITAGMPGRLDPRLLTIAAAATEPAPGFSTHDFCTGDRTDTDDPCHFGADLPPGWVLWGDSHATALADALGAVAARQGASFALRDSHACPPVPGIDILGQPGCRTRNQRTLERIIADPALTDIILVARYAAYLQGATSAYGPAEAAMPFKVADSRGQALPPSDAAAVMAGALRRSVDRLLAAGRSVWVLYPVPEVGYDVPRVAGILVRRGLPPDDFTRPYTMYQQRQAAVIAMLDSLPPSPRLHRLYPDRVFCGAAPDRTARCATMRGAVPLYRDGNHPSRAGARLVAALLAAPMARSVVDPGAGPAKP